jgi:hypothetical protein
VAEYELAAEPVWAHPAVLGDSILVKDRSGLTLWRLPSGDGS